jgi:hypothetical protein
MLAGPEAGGRRGSIGIALGGRPLVESPAGWLVVVVAAVAFSRGGMVGSGGFMFGSNEVRIVRLPSGPSTVTPVAAIACTVQPETSPPSSIVIGF